MADFARLAETARRLIRKNGRPAILRKLSRNPADPEKPWLKNSDAHQDVPLTVAFFDYEEGDIDDASVRRGDQIGYVEAPTTGEDLSTFDQVLDGDLTWRIENVQTIRPATQTVVYILQLRN